MKKNSDLKKSAVSFAVSLPRASAVFASVAAGLAAALPAIGLSAPLKSGDAAPLFKAKTHSGADFSLEERKGKGWTVLFFYPKAGTPGCTKQACAFRDSIQALRKLGTEVYGISGDSQEAQASFHKEHNLSFDLIADPDAKIIRQYDVKLPMLDMAKRWTFIIDDALKIRAIREGVDPVMDAAQVAKIIVELKAKP